VTFFEEIVLGPLIGYYPGLLWRRKEKIHGCREYFFG
jgi:hypothetical protein